MDAVGHRSELSRLGGLGLQVPQGLAGRPGRLGALPLPAQAVFLPLPDVYTKVYAGALLS